MGKNCEEMHRKQSVFVRLKHFYVMKKYIQKIALDLTGSCGYRFFYDIDLKWMFKKYLVDKRKCNGLYLILEYLMW